MGIITWADPAAPRALATIPAREFTQRDCTQAARMKHPPVPPRSQSRVTE
jgi:hypothetical protein